MVVTKGDSPNRRRSLAAAPSGQAAAVPRRRRAHSVIIPRTSLSPQAKARRLLVPRKSILKASFTPDDLEDEDVTQSMDFTQDYRARIHDNTTRKSFGGRRVSFAEHAHVRVFQIPDKNNPNAASSPRSPASSDVEQDDPPPPVADENDYPDTDPSRRRRSSVRHSTGSEMDITTVMGIPDTGAGILDEEFDEGDMMFSDDMDMEATQVFPGQIARQSMGGGRRETLPPSAILAMSDDPGSEGVEEEGEGDRTVTSAADDSIVSEAPSEKSQLMEFTIPMNQSLRPPAHEDPAWVALRQATHSGDTPYEPEDESLEEDYNQPNGGDMELGDAVQRLMRARESLSAQNQDDDTGQYDGQIQDDMDTISSTGSNNVEDPDSGNRTMNLSKVLGRVSMVYGEHDARPSLGYSEASMMDESEVYSNVLEMRRQSMAARQSLAPSQASTSSAPPPAPAPTQQQAPPPPSVFRPPPQTTEITAPPKSPAQTPSKPLPAPNPFAFSSIQSSSTPARSRPAPTTPNSKGKSKPSFTAAFAPPSSRTSPKKLPAKRALADENDAGVFDTDKPGPAKRQALDTRSDDPTSVIESTPKPRPLSPSKKNPFQPASTAASSSKPTSTASMSVVASNSQMRRPSGYMARRKSLATGPEPGGLAPKSPKQAGRMSLASAPQDAWTRFNKDVPLPKPKARFQDEPVPEPDAEPQPQLDVEEGAGMEDVEPHEPAPPARRASVRIISPDSSKPMAVDLSTLNEPEFGEDEMETGAEKAAQWREGVEDAGEYENEEEVPAISISQFFQMTGIKFMDELTAPRRSIHPSQNLTRQPREQGEIPISDYVIAMAMDIPQLELYTRVSRDLEAWMDKSKMMFAEAEEEAEKVTPELFVEYARADEKDQADILHQLNFIKTNTRGKAKSDWYDWKLKWVEGLHATAEQAFADLESDARKLEVLSNTANAVIPDLEREYEQIMAELERERAEVAEIEACDQDYLNELKASVAEQNIEVEALKAEVAEHVDQMKYFEDRKAENDAQKREIQGSIAKAERVLQIQKSSTRAEVFQLKDELEALEELHMVRVIRVNSQLFEYIYDSTFRVSIPCKNSRPVVAKIAISRLEPTRTRAKDDFPKLSSLFLTAATHVLDDDEDNTVPKIIHRLGDYWTCCSQLRSHLRLLNIKYPVDIDVAPPSPDAPSLPTFRVRTSVMFPKVAAKAIVSFVFNLQTFSQWPLSIDSLDCAVDVAYGALDRSAILKAVVDRLAEATPSDNYLFLDSCIAAQDLYK